jgi:uncharacterized protein YukE
MKNSEQKKHNPVKALMKAFYDDVNDHELQDNYNQFEKNLKLDKERYNKLIPQINQNLTTIQDLKESIFTQSLQGIIANNAIQMYKDVEKENETLMQKLGALKEEIKHTASLMEKYEDWSGRKLFTWWKAICAVEPKTLPWADWKKTYEGKII